jgi:peptidyl-prolyl cis-trans isomerase NIMA-interacting 1
MGALLSIGRLLLASSLVSGCVVTTLEGPGEAPRVISPPERPDRAKALAEESSAPEPTPKIGARHLLVAYAGAMRASAEITRTKEEAQTRASQALERARGGEPFEKLVSEYSDEPGAAERAGDLGLFERGAMVKPFSDAAFALSPGAISDVVETPFGFHVIQRTQ